MKKFKSRKAGCLFSIIKILLVIVVLGFLGLYFFSGKIINTAISTTGKLAGVDMNGSASISWKSLEFSIDDFYIANPEGFSKANAISFKQAYFKPTLSFGAIDGSAPLVIDEIRIVGVSLLLEKNGLLSPSNLSEIKDKFAALVPESEGAPQQEKKEESPEQKSERKFIIKKLVFEDGNVAFISKGENLTQELPSFTLTNLGGENGATSSELMGEVLVQLIDQAVRATAKSAVDISTKEGGNAVDTISDKLKNLLK